MPAPSYSITIRHSANNNYVITRELSDGVTTIDAATDKTLEEALDLLKAWVVANPVTRLTTTAING